MADRIKVSICIPAYKQFFTLKRCLDSIASQNYTDYEVIISDDSPNNDIQNLVDTYQNLPVIYHKNTKALGSPENWNHAIRLASGEYIKIMHHDDWFASSASLQQFVELLDKHPEVSFGFSACKDMGVNQIISRHPNVFELKSLRKNPDILALGNLIGAPSVTIFRNHSDIFFDKQLIWLVDIEFYIRFLRKYPGFAYTSADLINIGLSENQITNQCKDDKELIQKEKDYLSQKLNLQDGTFYPGYHHLKNVFIPEIKKKVKRIWK
ncbi:MAG: glycosyltransferase [Candidatus Symbiothrix sp.]|jgi:glycosyltransferase involved in cell wall biosynthesis|nr:glycosyltransferase [Candidatus Symbiothrix sp.]